MQAAPLEDALAELELKELNFGTVAGVLPRVRALVAMPPTWKVATPESREYRELAARFAWNADRLEPVGAERFTIRARLPPVVSEDDHERHRQALEAVEEETRSYQHLLREERTLLSCERLPDEIPRLDQLVAQLQAAGVPADHQPIEGRAPQWPAFQARIELLSKLLGKGPRLKTEKKHDVAEAWLNLRKHTFQFTQGVDLRSIVEHDWPRVRAGLRSLVYEKDEPASPRWIDVQRVVDAPARNAGLGRDAGGAGEAAFETGRVFATDFRVIGRLGSGGFGTVYEVDQLSTGRRVALKVLLPEIVNDPDIRARFEREARVAAGIDSDHIAAVVGAGIDSESGIPWIAMELLRGETIARRVQRSGPVDFGMVVTIFEQMAHALGRAHARGIVHRDIKPENVFLAEPRHHGGDAAFVVKILDFGIAKLVTESGSHATGGLGTLLWMAPEQMTGAVVSPATDVWALGLLAFYLLTAKRFFEAPMEAIANRPNVRARAEALGVAHLLPATFDEWLSQCLENDPSKRPLNSDAAAMRVTRV